MATTVALLAATASSALAAPSNYFDFTNSFTEDTGIVCGSGPSSFDVINSETRHKYGPIFSDVNGNFVKDILYSDIVGTFSNSVTGTSIAYKSRQVEHDSIAIPGDFNSTFTAVTTGEMVITSPGGGVVWQNTGRVIDSFDPNGNETLTWTGRRDDLVYGFLGQTSVADKLCAALGA
jgi:ABC-type antimicrobial peptide transport system permease subunit